MKGREMERETRTVLIVDGSATMLYYHSILLKRLSYATVSAASAEDALAVLERTLPSLVLTEISLPWMNGQSFIKAIKENDRTRGIPVIVLTGEDDQGTRAACLGLGCADYLVKPIDAGTLYRSLQAASEPAPRSHIRLATSLETIVGDGAASAERAIAISAGGLFIRTDRPRPKNTLLSLRIRFPEREVEAKAVVLYAIGQGGRPDDEQGMGMKFVEIAERDRIFIQNFIQRHLTGDLIEGNSIGGAPANGG